MINGPFTQPLDNIAKAYQEIHKKTIEDAEKAESAKVEANTQPLKEGFDDYNEIAKELIKRSKGKVTKEHIRDLEDERDSRGSLDWDEVAHHIKKHGGTVVEETKKKDKKKVWSKDGDPKEYGVDKERELAKEEKIDEISVAAEKNYYKKSHGWISKKTRELNKRAYHAISADEVPSKKERDKVEQRKKISNKVYHKLMDETQLDEISKRALTTYIDKSAQDYNSANKERYNQLTSFYTTAEKRRDKRLKGIGTAFKKLQNKIYHADEETQFEEGFAPVTKDRRGKWWAVDVESGMEHHGPFDTEDEAHSAHEKWEAGIAREAERMRKAYMLQKSGKMDEAKRQSVIDVSSEDAARSIRDATRKNYETASKQKFRTDDAYANAFLYPKIIGKSKGLKIPFMSEGLNEALDVPTPSAEELAKKYKLSLDQITQMIKVGAEVEKEHTTTEKNAEEIARDHLGERPDYYDKLKKMEDSKVTKPVKEETLDEISFDKLDRYMPKAQKELQTYGMNKPETDLSIYGDSKAEQARGAAYEKDIDRRRQNRKSGLMTAYLKMKARAKIPATYNDDDLYQREETELNELNRSTLASYIPKAYASGVDSTSDAQAYYVGWTDPDKPRQQRNLYRKSMEKNWDKVGNRARGVRLATKKLQDPKYGRFATTIGFQAHQAATKEETELNELQSKGEFHQKFKYGDWPKPEPAQLSLFKKKRKPLNKRPTEYKKKEYKSFPIEVQKKAKLVHKMMGQQAVSRYEPAYREGLKEKIAKSKQRQTKSAKNFKLSQTQWIKMKNEETQLDELNRSTLASYIKKAHVSGLKAAAEGEEAYQDNYHYGRGWDTFLKKMYKANAVGEKRERGINLAAKKLQDHKYGRFATTIGFQAHQAAAHRNEETINEGKLRPRKISSIMNDKRDWQGNSERARGNPEYPAVWPKYDEKNIGGGVLRTTHIPKEKVAEYEKDVVKKGVAAGKFLKQQRKDWLAKKKGEREKVKIKNLGVAWGFNPGTMGVT